MAGTKYVTACWHIRKHFFRTDSGTRCCKWICMVEIFLATATLPYTKHLQVYNSTSTVYPISVLSCVCRCCMLSIFYIFANLLGKIVYICISSYNTIFLQCIVWLSWFKGTLYVCLCKLHAQILCPSIRLLLLFLITELYGFCMSIFIFLSFVFAFLSLFIFTENFNFYCETN